MEKTRPGKTITVHMEKERQTLELPYCKTVLQLLGRLNLRPTDCLVIREPMEQGQKRSLLTHDLRIEQNAILTIRKVTSSG